MKSKSPFLNRTPLLSKSPFASKSPLLSKSPFLQTNEHNQEYGQYLNYQNSSEGESEETDSSQETPPPTSSDNTTTSSDTTTTSSDTTTPNTTGGSGGSGEPMGTAMDVAMASGMTKEEWYAANPNWNQQFEMTQSQIQTQEAIDAADQEALDAGGYETGTSSGLDDEMLTTAAGQTGNPNSQVETANSGAGAGSTAGGGSSWQAPTDSDELASQEVASGPVADAQAAGTLENPTNTNSGTVVIGNNSNTGTQGGAGGTAGEVASSTIPAVGTGSGPADGNSQNQFQSDPGASATGNVSSPEAQTVQAVTTSMENDLLAEVAAEGGDPDGILETSHNDSVEAALEADAAEGTSSTTSTPTPTSSDTTTPVGTTPPADTGIQTTNNSNGGAPSGDPSGNLPGSMGGEDMKCGNYQGDGGLYADAGLDPQSQNPEDVVEDVSDVNESEETDLV